MKYNLNKIKKLVNKAPLTKERLAKISFHIYLYIYEYYNERNYCINEKFKLRKTKFKKKNNIDIIKYYDENESGYTLDTFAFISYININDDIIKIIDNNIDYENPYIYYNIKTNILYFNDYNMEEQEIYYDDYTIKFLKNNFEPLYLKNNIIYGKNFYNKQDWTYIYKYNNQKNEIKFSSKIIKEKYNNKFLFLLQRNKYDSEYVYEEIIKIRNNKNYGYYLDNCSYITSKMRYINKYKYKYKPYKNIEYYFNYININI